MWTLRIWDELKTPLHLWRPWQDFCRGKRRREDVAAFSLDADRHVHRLARDIGDGSYRPGPYRLLFIHDPKRRIVAAAPVRDRVVHHAIYRLVAPRFNAALVDHSYACLPNRGAHRAVLRYLAQARRFRYVLPLDIHRYYYSIDRGLLRALLFRHLPERQTRALLDRILQSGAGLYRRRDVADWLAWDSPMPDGVGLPIGNLTSQWWGNFYLGALDHFACRALRVPSYQRYMDDITVFGDNRDALLRMRDQIADWLAKERRLRLKDPDARLLRTDGRLQYLGYTITRAGVSLGPKARERMRTNLCSAACDSERLRAVVASYASAWLFGS